MTAPTPHQDRGGDVSDHRAAHSFPWNAWPFYETWERATAHIDAQADRIKALEAEVARLAPKHRQLPSWDGSTCMGGGFAGCKQPGVTWFDNSIDPLWLCAYHAVDQ